MYLETLSRTNKNRGFVKTRKQNGLGPLFWRRLGTAVLFGTFSQTVTRLYYGAVRAHQRRSHTHALRGARAFLRFSL